MSGTIDLLRGRNVGRSDGFSNWDHICDVAFRCELS